MSDPSTFEATLHRLFDAERAVRGLRDEVDAAARRGAGATFDAVGLAITAARAEASEDERTLRLAALAGVLGELSGARAVDLLIDILASEEAEARHAAGSELEELASHRFKEVALGVERALGRLPDESPALSELPYILADIPEPGVTKLLGLFLAHRAPDAVAAGIDVAVLTGDRALLPALAKLAGDKRVVAVDDDENEDARATIDELAREATSLLEAD